MAAVTQSIPNFLGGVSSQPDEKKTPGQVNNIINGYPDPTFGLTKRNGTQFIQTLDSGSSLDDASWFFINRSAAESYFGCVTTGGDMRIWNAITRTEASVTYTGSAKNYLQAGLGHGDYEFTTIQDLTYVINKTKEVKEKTTGGYQLGRYGTIILKEISPKQVYTVYIDGQAIDYTSPEARDTLQGETAINANELLTELKAKIDAAGLGLNVTQLADSLELSRNTPFTLDVKGAISGRALESYQDDIGNAGRLARNSVNGRLVKVTNSADERSAYFVEFVADQSSNTQGGYGYYKETRGWDTDEDGNTTRTSEGLDASTMPHQLVNTATNVFRFELVDYEDRLVGNELSNSPPSFVGATINKGFLHSNRLGFLSNENVIMSQSGEFNNFYYVTAQTVVDSDPIDLNCSSIRPAQLFSVIPQATGLILFSKFEQFRLFSDDAALTATDSIIRSIANYEADDGVEPVDVGTSIVFISKTPNFTRTMAMSTRSNPNGEPVIVDIGKVASEFVPSTIDTMIASPQNSFVGMSTQNSNEIYFYRFFNTGEKDIMQAWYKWELPGNVQTFAVAQDMMFFVVKTGDQYVLLGTSIAQLVLEGSMTARANPRLDMFFPVTGGITFDSSTGLSKITKPYNATPDLTPIIVTTPEISVPTKRTSIFDIPLTLSVNDSSGYEGGDILPVTEDGTSWYFPGDWTSYSDKLIGGYKYDLDVDLPTTYFRGDQTSDYTANLTISRYRFSFGDSGDVTFYSKAYGSDEWIMLIPTPDANYYLANEVAFTKSSIMTVPIYQKNNYFNFRVTSDTPLPVSLNSMMWEGQYSPRYYQRA